MSQEYKVLTGIDLIKGFCSEVLAYGIKNGLSVDGVKIWMHPKIAQSLELGVSLSVETEGHIYNVPVIVETTIKETPLNDGRFQSDIFIGDPDWSVGVAEGEFWFERDDKV